MKAAGLGVQAFTARLAVESQALFVMDHGHRLWFDRDNAMAFAFVLSVLYHRKQRVHAELVDGRWCWHVRTIPVSKTDDGAGAPLAAAGSPVPVAAASPGPAPSSAVQRCSYREPVS